MTDSNENSSDGTHTATKNDGTTYFVQEDESVTEAVVRAVSDEKRFHPIEIEPLYSVVDTDALNTLFASRISGDRRIANGTVVFRYSDYDIRVTDNGEVILKESGTE